MLGFGLPEFITVYQLMLKRKQTILFQDKYYVPARKVSTLTVAQVKIFLKKHNARKWKSFYTFVEEENKIWYIQPDVSNWKLGKCSCPFYAKNYKCKHLKAISATLRLYAIPPEAKQIQLGQKRKRGAPSKARPALFTK